jgi:hypothetical protein
MSLSFTAKEGEQMKDWPPGSFLNLALSKILLYYLHLEQLLNAILPIILTTILTP